MKADLKAYEVRDSDEGNCCIAFATNSAAARREGAGELNSEWEGIESCRRAPWADEYAPGPVPLAATIDAGWWHGCNHCECTFDSDGRRDGESWDRDDACEPITARGMNFCSPTCAMEQWAERRVRQSLESAVIEACALHWPGAIKITAHERSMKTKERESEWYAMFTVPGLQCAVDWTLGDKQVMVSQCDVEAFKAWKAISA